MGLAADAEPYLRMILQYQRQAISAQTVERIAERVLHILRQLIADPEIPVGALDVLHEAERDRLLLAFNQTATQTPALTLPALFERKAAETPDEIAVLFEDEKVTYGELDARANRLARALVERGVGPETVVGVALRRSPQWPVAVLAVTKAGGAYLPLDPAYPADRLTYMVEDSAIGLILTDGATADRLPDLPSQLLVLDAPEFAEALADTDGAVLTDAQRLSPLVVANTAYVIYTSGSTEIAAEGRGRHAHGLRQHGRGGDGAARHHRREPGPAVRLAELRHLRRRDVHVPVRRGRPGHGGPGPAHAGSPARRDRRHVRGDPRDPDAHGAGRHAGWARCPASPR